LVTIEGKINDNGSRNGIGVFRRRSRRRIDNGSSGTATKRKDLFSHQTPAGIDLSDASRTTLQLANRQAH